MSLIDRITTLKKNYNLSKHEHLVQGVIEAVDRGELIVGDKLPSINKMVKDIGYARKTIFRAYEELKAKGLIESRKLKGYYLISVETNVTLKIALLLFAFQSFQEEFYNTFRNELGKRFHIDVFFHHNNIAIFETIFSNIRGKYGMYVVAPIQNPSLSVLLQSIVPQKLLLVDRYLSLGPEYSFISQEFENATYNKLVELLPAIKRYKRFVLFFNEDAYYTPLGILRAFNKFLLEHNIDGVVEKNYSRGSVKKGYLYMIVNDTILWQVLRDCEQEKLSVGEDIGILSHNDDIAKQIVFGGITTFSTDFADMARRAASHIKYREKTQKIMPFNLIRRKSL